MVADLDQVAGRGGRGWLVKLELELRLRARKRFAWSLSAVSRFCNRLVLIIEGPELECAEVAIDRGGVHLQVSRDGGELVTVATGG